MVVNSGSKTSQLAICAVALMAVVAVACGPDAPVTPEEVLEKALEVMRDQEGYHVEYDYHTVDVVKDGSSDDGEIITIDRAVVADFQAPDRIRLRGGMVSSWSPGGNVDGEFDEIWVGNVVYVGSSITGRWRTITYPDKYVQTPNEVIDIALDSFSVLEFAEPESLDGHESFKLVGTALPVGLYSSYLEWDANIREIRVEYHIGKDDYLIRQFVFDAESYDDVKSHTVTYRFSAFDSPVTIDIPEVAPPTPP